MERLTKHYAKGITTASNREIICSNYCNMCSIGTGNCTIVKHMVERLAEIEDILGDDYDLERLKELVQADREGKVILRHIKEGGKVYIILLGRILPFDVISATLYGENIVYEAEHGMCLKYRFDNTDIGKSVFLTRQEAEAALKKMKEGDE